MHEIKLATRRTSELVDITEVVQSELASACQSNGICNIFCPHTTAGLLINECADPAVAHDIVSFLEELVPRNRAWTHAEGNSPAHVKAALIGNALQVVFEDRKLVLGTWQGIFFCEFDGPRERRIWVQITSE